MRRLMVILFIMVGAGFAAGSTPAAAQEHGVAPPTLAEVKSYRIGTLLSFNDLAVRVCRSDVESANRNHWVCKDLVTVSVPPIPEFPPSTAGMIEEFIIYDGTFYYRANEETTWTATPMEGYDPNLTLVECCFTWTTPSVVTRIGPAMLDGVQTTHYQWWVTDTASNQAHNGQVVYDQFVTADGFVLADQLHSRGTFAGLGTGQFSARWGYSDINAPIVVSPPPADRIRASSTASTDRWLGMLRMQMRGNR